ncbi:MAG: hypothetical protein ACR2IH_06705 [Pyrinomonadaceae bacterium]
MQEKPKPSDKGADEKKGAAEADQTERPYYYDDAHGYEIFEDDENDYDEDDSMVDAESPKPR